MLFISYIYFLDNSHLPFTSVPSLAVIAGMVGNEMPTVSSFSSQQSNTEPPTRPAFYSLNAAVASTSSTMGNYYKIIIKYINYYSSFPYY